MAKGDLQIDIIARDRASQAFDKVAGSAGKTSKVIRAGAKVAALGFAAVAVGAVKLAQGAADDQKAAAALAKTLKNTTGATDAQVASVEDWISAQGRALGISDDKLRPSLSALATATGDIGKAQKLASLAMDVSAGSGKSLETVTQALVKAQNGSVGGLSRLGIATKDAAGKTKSFAQIQADLSKKFGGQAATAAETMSGKMQRLKLTLSEAGESIGYKLLPVAVKLADWFLNQGIPAAGRFADWFGQNVMPKLHAFGDFIASTVLPKLREFGDWIGNHVVPALKRFGDKAGESGGFLDTLKTSASIAFIFLRDVAAPIVKKLAEKILPLWANYMTRGVIPAITNVMKAVLVMGGAGVTAFGWILHAAAKGFGWIPGIGPKLKAADAKFGAFASSVQAQLNKLSGLGGQAKAQASAVGKYWGQGFTAGIMAEARSAYNAGGYILNQVNAGAKRAGMIQSPSRKAMELGRFWGLGLEKGVAGRLVNVRNAGASMMQALVSGMKNKWTSVKDFLGKVNDLVASKRDALSSIMQTRNDFASSLASSFSSSIFGRDVGSDANGNALSETLGGIRGFALQQRAQAEQLSRDVKRLVGLGLSKSLLAQLQSQGTSGLAQIRTLAATASRSDIAFLNNQDRATAGALSAAGMSAANSIFGADIAKRSRENSEAVSLLRELRDATKGGQQLEVRLDGDVLVLAIKRSLHNKGKRSPF